MDAGDRGAIGAPGKRGFGDTDGLGTTRGGVWQAVARIIRTAVPPRVITRPDDIEADLLLDQVIEKPLRPSPVAAAINVNHNPRRWIAGGISNPLDGGFEQ